MVDISNIVVSWNAKELLHDCLESLTPEKSEYSTETIVIDNASTDGAPDMVEKKFPYVKLIRNKKNLGFAKANNQGMKLSKGRYICLVNSDAVALDDCLNRMCNYMDKNSNIGALGPKVLNPNGTLQPTCRKFPTLWSNFCRALALDKLFPNYRVFARQFMTFISHTEINEVDYISGCFIMARKTAINQVGMFDEDFFFYAEDKDWCKRFWKNGWKVVYYPEVKAMHHLYGSTLNNPVKFYIQEVKANLQYYEKHHNSLSRLGYLSTVFLHQLNRIIYESIFFLLKPSRRRESREKLNRSLKCLKWVAGSRATLNIIR